MAAQDRWSLAYFGHMVVKNGIKVAKSNKWELSKFAESKTYMDRVGYMGIENDDGSSWNLRTGPSFSSSVAYPSVGGDASITHGSM